MLENFTSFDNSFTFHGVIFIPLSDCRGIYLHKKLKTQTHDYNPKPKYEKTLQLFGHKNSMIVTSIRKKHQNQTLKFLI